jgi:hypothetical protein
MRESFRDCSPLGAHIGQPAFPTTQVYVPLKTRCSNLSGRFGEKRSDLVGWKQPFMALTWKSTRKREWTVTTVSNAAVQLNTNQGLAELR